jgi:hypothetical protein
VRRENATKASDKLSPRFNLNPSESVGFLEKSAEQAKIYDKSRFGALIYINTRKAPAEGSSELENQTLTTISSSLTESLDIYFALFFVINFSEAFDHDMSDKHSTRERKEIFVLVRVRFRYKWLGPADKNTPLRRAM